MINIVYELDTWLNSPRVNFTLKIDCLVGLIFKKIAIKQSGFILAME